MFRGLKLKLAIVAGAAAAATAVAMATPHVVSLGGPDGVTHVGKPINGTTAIALSPAANPAFKIDGGTSCDKPGTTGHLWQGASVSAASLVSSSVDRVEVTFGKGSSIAVVTLTPGNGWTSTLSSTASFACGSLAGSSLPYTAKSYDSHKALDTTDGSYPISSID